MRNLKVLLFVLALNLLPCLLYAQAPNLIHYQGRLVDGTNLVNGNVTMLLQLYDANSAGNMLYEDSSTVSVVDGLYSTYMGDNTSAGSLTNAFAKPEIYLQVVINGKTLSPRERVVSAPYALYPAAGGSSPSGSIVLSETHPNPVLESSGYQPMPGNASSWIMTQSVAFPARYRHTSVVYDDKIWVLGGKRDSSTYLNDVWCSSNGLDWICATTNAAWTSRYEHTSLVYDNKIWVLGGRGQSNTFHDVWYSTNGTEWICVTDSASWSSRSGHTSLTYNNKMWVLGGWTNDVWCSTNGVDWICVTNNAAWPHRSGLTSLIYDNKIWVLGGYYMNDPQTFQAILLSDVWSSSDGIDWFCVTNIAVWSSRYRHTSVVYDDKIWVLGGEKNGYLNDIWYSTNGIDWGGPSYGPWLARSGHTSVIFNNRIWVLSGESAGDLDNDAWYMSEVRCSADGLYYYRKN